MANVTTLLKSSLKTSAVKSLYYDVVSNLANYYYTFGKSTPWPTVTNVDPDTNISVVVSDDDNPPSVSDTYAYELDVRKNMHYVKMINTNDAAIVVPRYDWIVGTAYDQYDDYTDDRPARSGVTSIAEAKFFVLTDELHVYKCLFNNKNAVSIVKPTGTRPQAFTTSDGYIWKYMYTIPLSLKNKFLQSNYMPVITSLTNQFYGNGSIRSYRINKKGSGYVPNTWIVKQVRVINPGSGYSLSPGTVLQFDTPPTGGVLAEAVVSQVDSNGGVVEISVTDQGAGYRVQPDLKITSAPEGAQGLEFLVEYENVNTNGSTRIEISGDGFNALNPYSIKQIEVLNRGTFNEVPQGEFFAWPAVGEEYGQIPDVDITFRLKNGSTSLYEIDTIIINSGGFGYKEPLEYGVNVLSPVLQTAGVVLNFRKDTQKNEAILVPLINSAGEITAIRVAEQGIGYTYASVRIIGTKLFNIMGDNPVMEQTDDPASPFYVSTFRRADITLNFSVGDANTKQSDVELLAVDGSIEVINVDNGGTGFSSTSVLQVVGDGVDCTCTPIIDNNGSLSKVIVTNPGRGYTFANVIVSGGGSGATIRPIISPKGGHGKDAIEELYAKTILFTTRLVNEKNQGSPIMNDFRQITIVKDLAAYNSDNFYSAAIGSACALLRLEKTNQNATLFSLIQRDDTLYRSNDNTKFVKVVEKTNTSDFYELVVNLETNWLPTFSDNLEKVVDQTTSLIVSLSSVVPPTVDKYSGQMMYVDNRTPFVSNDEQTVVVNTLITL